MRAVPPANVCLVACARIVIVDDASTPNYFAWIRVVPPGTETAPSTPIAITPGVPINIDNVITVCGGGSDCRSLSPPPPPPPLSFPSRASLLPASATPLAARSPNSPRQLRHGSRCLHVPRAPMGSWYHATQCLACGHSSQHARSAFAPGCTRSVPLALGRVAGDVCRAVGPHAGCLLGDHRPRCGSRHCQGPGHAVRFVACSRLQPPPGGGGCPSNAGNCEEQGAGSCFRSWRAPSEPRARAHSRPPFSWVWRAVAPAWMLCACGLGALCAWRQGARCVRFARPVRHHHWPVRVLLDGKVRPRPPAEPHAHVPQQGYAQF